MLSRQNILGPPPVPPSGTGSLLLIYLKYISIRPDGGLRRGPPMFWRLHTPLYLRRLKDTPPGFTVTQSREASGACEGRINMTIKQERFK